MLKYKIFFLVLALLTPVFLLGQLSQEPQTMSLGVQYAFVLKIPDTDKKIIDSEWKNYLKEYGKVKRNRKAKEYFMMDESIPEVHGSGNIDTYMKSEDDQISVFFDLGNQFLDADHSDHDKAAEFVVEFGYTVERAKINVELAEEEKALKKLTRQKSKLEKDHKKYLRNIESAKKKIEINEDNIKKNESDHEKTLDLIVDQEQKIKLVEKKLQKVGKSD